MRYHYNAIMMHAHKKEPVIHVMCYVIAVVARYSLLVRLFVVEMSYS